MSSTSDLTDNLTISQARELLRLSGASSEFTTRDLGVSIVVLQRGWVAVGHLFQTGEEIRMTNAATVRVWGTTAGLGQLALSGPTKETKLDDCGEVRAHVGAVIFTLPCDTKKVKAWHARE